MNVLLELVVLSDFRTEPQSGLQAGSLFEAIECSEPEARPWLNSLLSKWTVVCSPEDYEEHKHKHVVTLAGGKSRGSTTATK